MTTITAVFLGIAVCFAVLNAFQAGRRAERRPKDDLVDRVLKVARDQGQLIKTLEAQRDEFGKQRDEALRLAEACQARR